MRVKPKMYGVWTEKTYSELGRENERLTKRHAEQLEIIEELRARLAAAEAWNEYVMTQKKCRWTYDETSEHYDTGCGKAWCFMEDGIEENGVKFCPFCGGFIQAAGGV